MLVMMMLTMIAMTILESFWHNEWFQVDLWQNEEKESCRRGRDQGHVWRGIYFPHRTVRQTKLFHFMLIFPFSGKESTNDKVGSFNVFNVLL